MVSSLKHKIFHGFLWVGVEQAGSQFITIIISIVLARLLAPEQFGLLAIVTSFTLIAGTFVNSGLGTALIQKKKSTQEDENSVFYSNLVIGLISYGVLFFGAPLIGHFYGNPILVPLLRTSSLCIIFFALSIVQDSLLIREMAFHLRFRINWAALLVSGLIGIWMAYYGFGVWALATQQIVKSFITMLGLWLWVGWRPGLHSNWSSLKEMLGYGSKILGAALLDKIFLSLYPLLIGRFFGGNKLGLFDRGQYYPQAVVGSISGIFLKVLFPAFTLKQEDMAALKTLFRKSIQMCACFVIPLSLGFVVIAPSFVQVFMGTRWMPCVVFLQISCFTFVWWPFHVLCLQLINATGYSGQMLILELIKKGLAVLILLITWRYGIIVVTYGIALGSLLSLFINVFPCRRIIHYRYTELIMDIKNSFFLSLIMLVCTLFPTLWLQPGIELLLCQLLFGVVVYVGLAWILKMQEVRYFAESLISEMRRGFKK